MTDPVICQGCGRDLYAGPQVPHPAFQGKLIHEARIGSVIVDVSGPRPLFICRWCAAKAAALDES